MERQPKRSGDKLVSFFIKFKFVAWMVMRSSTVLSRAKLSIRGSKREFLVSMHTRLSKLGDACMPSVFSAHEKATIFYNSSTTVKLFSSSLNIY